MSSNLTSPTTQKLVIRNSRGDLVFSEQCDRCRLASKPCEVSTAAIRCLNCSNKYCERGGVSVTNIAGFNEAMTKALEDLGIHVRRGHLNSHGNRQRSDSEEANSTPTRRTQNTPDRLRNSLSSSSDLSSVSQSPMTLTRTGLRSSGDTSKSRKRKRDDDEKGVSAKCFFRGFALADDIQRLFEDADPDGEWATTKEIKKYVLIIKDTIRRQQELLEGE